jgi:hypothetical protein
MEGAALRYDNRAKLCGAALLVLSIQAGCGDPADMMIRQVDAMSASERPHDWETTRRLMTRPAPRVGEPAPDFRLPLVDGSGEIVRSQFSQGKPAVLIFGSFT